MSAESMRRAMRNPWKLGLYMLGKLPMGLLAGLRIVAFDEEMAAVSIRLGYLTKNPFRSIYFACLSMAAEMASGAQGIVHVAAGSPVSMLIVGIEGTFSKKATGRITFTCPDGAAIAKAVEEARSTGESRSVVCTSTGRDAAGDEVATFRLTWSFKTKSPSPKG